MRRPCPPVWVASAWPVEVVTDAAAVYPRVLDELVPAAWHYVERWANNRIEADQRRSRKFSSDELMHGGRVAEM